MSGLSIEFGSNNNLDDNEEYHTEFKPISEWIFCICVVAFDLELGQAIECMYPKKTQFNEKQLSDLCYLSFPDSNSNCIGDTQYVIRLKFNYVHSDNENSKEFKSFVQSESSFIWGFVSFRQIRDRSIPRGYFQKSVVIFSFLPFFNLFKQISTIIALNYFDHGCIIFEDLATEIKQWPKISFENVLYLSLTRHIFQAIIPTNKMYGNSSQINGKDYDSLIITNKNQNIITSLNVEKNQFDQILLQLSNNLHLIWELILIADPIVIIAPSPEICSNAVLTLVNMILPIKYSGDYRPFFTIHDSDFKKIANAVNGSPSAIIGVTNPFFLKSLNHWPNIILLNGNNDVLCTLKKIQDLKNSSKLMDTSAGIYTNYKSCIQKGKSHLKKFINENDSKKSLETVQKYLENMTANFLIPLEEYMTSLLPHKNIVSPFKAVPLLGQFNPDDFVSSLERNGPQITTGIKGDWPGLYRRFFRSVNFSYWFDVKYKELNENIQILYLNSLANTNIVEWSQNRPEVEVVDMFIKIRHKIKMLKNFESTISISIRNKLDTNLKEILSTLPNDLQSILNNS